MARPSKTDHVVIGIHVSDRVEQASRVQEILTRHGRTIKTRIGLHDVGKDFCSPSGVILLEMFGDESVCEELRKKLAAIDGIEVQQMIFDHD